MTRQRSKGRAAPPSSGSTPREEAVPGARCKVTYARKLNDSLPAKEYLGGLSPEVRAKFFMLFLSMANAGKITNTEKFRPKVGKVNCGPIEGQPEWLSVGEFKVHNGPGYRILACHDGDEWVLTHGFKKGKKVEDQIKVAEANIQEDRSRGRSR